MKKKGFTLIELLVVIAIIALLMSILMPALTKIKRQAQGSICMSNLKQWGLTMAMYTDAYDGHFITGADWSTTSLKHPGQGNINCDGEWIWALEPYYKPAKAEYDSLGRELGGNGPDIIRCPTATKKMSAAGNLDITFVAWEGGGISTDAQYIQDHRWVGTVYGSYGVNRVVEDMPTDKPGVDATVKAYYDKRLWRTTKMQQAYLVPLFLDCSQAGAGWVDGSEGGLAPDFQGESMALTGCENVAFQLNRHGNNTDGVTQGVFCDYSVRRIGLKELWELHWDRLWMGENGTIRNSDAYLPSNAWPEWMKKFKVYSRYEPAN